MKYDFFCVFKPGHRRSSFILRLKHDSPTLIFLTFEPWETGALSYTIHIFKVSEKAPLKYCKIKYSFFLPKNGLNLKLNIVNEVHCEKIIKIKSLTLILYWMSLITKCLKLAVGQVSTKP